LLAAYEKTKGVAQNTCQQQKRPNGSKTNQKRMASFFSSHPNDTSQTASNTHTSNMTQAVTHALSSLRRRLGIV